MAKINEQQKLLMSTLKDSLVYGDQTKIAEKTGLSRVYVNYCFAGQFYNQAVVEAATELIQNRKAVIAEAIETLQA